MRTGLKEWFVPLRSVPNLNPYTEYAVPIPYMYNTIPCDLIQGKGWTLAKWS